MRSHRLYGVLGNRNRSNWTCVWGLENGNGTIYRHRSDHGSNDHDDAQCDDQFYLFPAEPAFHLGGKAWKQKKKAAP